MWFNLNLDGRENRDYLSDLVDFAQIELFCQKNHIASLKLFGSILTNNFNEKSDIDLLIEFEPDFIPGFFAYEALQNELSALFHDRRVDLRTKDELSPYFRDLVFNQAVKIYDIPWLLADVSEIKNAEQFHQNNLDRKCPEESWLNFHRVDTSFTNICD